MFVHDRLCRGNTQQAAFLIIAHVDHLIGARRMRMLSWEWRGDLRPGLRGRPGWIGKRTMSRLGGRERRGRIVFAAIASRYRITGSSSSRVLNRHDSFIMLIGSSFSRLIHL